MFSALTGVGYFISALRISSACWGEARIMDSLLKPVLYNKNKLPGMGTTVRVEFWIAEINSVDEVSNEFDMELYINELWLDPKLRFDPSIACRANLSLDQGTLDKLWKPNSCFVNSKSAEIMDSPFTNIFLTLFSNGTVWVNYRVRVRGPCAMDLAAFPMDQQSCRLMYQSFSYNNAAVRMRWNGRSSEPVRPLRDIRLPDFRLSKINPTVIQRSYPAGTWDELIVTFTFQRRYVWFLLQAYLPTYFSIFISWLAFSLGPESISPRTMIGVNSLLSMIFHFGSIMRNLPRVSYVKAIDVWMLCSMMFVFLSLVELAIVGLCDNNKSRVAQIDAIARLAFPAAFSIFNIVYWAHYGMQVV